MKNLSYISTLFCLILVTATACDMQSVLDEEPVDQISEEAIWDDPALIEAYINDIYLGMGHGLYEVMLSSAADETHFTHGYGVPQIVESNVSPSDRGSFGSRDDYNHWDWEDLYFRIQQVNTLLAEIEDSAIEDQAVIDSYIGQAHFLRAYFYHNLLRIYGGVPILTEPASLNDEDLTPPRNSFAETVDFIVAEADSAAALLPPEQTGEDLGRASAAAALALKSRILLYAASDLAHENPGGVEVTGYTGGADQQQMWREAKEAARAVMDLGIYSLYLPEPENQEAAAQNYYQLFLTEAPENPETIMERYFLETRDDGHNPGLDNGPNGYYNWAGNTPVQNLVDDYQMEDGSEFDWNNPDHASDPYEDRDPRFEASILYDGAEWMERPDDASAAFDADGVIQTVMELDLGDATVAGVDTRGGPIEDWNGTYTGYYLKKFIRDDMHHGQNNKQEGSWIFFRYTEILLNYAEASIELGEYGDARRELNKIRTRAGMPTYTSIAGEELMEEYRNERRIEMAFEEQRYFDVRRWMIAPEVMDEDARRIYITADAEEQSDRSTYSNYEYEVRTVGPGSRSWDDKMYFQPIPFEEMNRNDELEQNPGY
ncbi:Starch-binding associating with outer membrane [Fodinibius roseus]|uniref:Starch-binding associating with outer membrane n=1 Tax=Fodinibius roseus TaxID=1194090 RepID=A0A1M5C033_9BACT|nr:RagB/SusD family nutrient uptake outer membrane protein [Fodinibius roseus]SHF48045.1 Starch-binding associating with outer membrane [Fodinibius roseus]